MSEGRERSHSLSEDEDAERSRREAALEIVMSATLPERRNSAVSRAVSKLTNGKFGEGKHREKAKKLVRRLSQGLMSPSELERGGRQRSRSYTPPDSPPPELQLLAPADVVVTTFVHPQRCCRNKQCV